MTKSTLSEVELLRLKLRSQKKVTEDQLAVIKTLKEENAKKQKEIENLEATVEWMKYDLNKCDC